MYNLVKCRKTSLLSRSILVFERKDIKHKETLDDNTLTKAAGGSETARSKLMFRENRDASKEFLNVQLCFISYQPLL